MDDAFERAASRERTEARRLGFRIHLWVYLAVNVLLVATWALTGGSFPWFIFPLLGWGIGVVAHYAAIRPVSLSRERPAA